MEIAIVLLAVAGWFYNKRVTAANAYAHAQCSAYREAVKAQAQRKPHKVKRSATPEHQQQETQESFAADEDPGVPSV